MSKAKLVDFRFHDLRHSAASYLAMNGASSIEIAAVLGHKTLQMVKRYSHLGNSHPRLIPASNWNGYHAWPPNGGLRHLIFHAKSNGFNNVIRRVGRRVLIDEVAFFEWVDGKGAPK